MSQLPSADHSSPQPKSSEVSATGDGFEIKVHAFWTRNRGFIFLLCGIVLVGIVGREGWQYFQGARERGIQREYAQISDKPERLAAFADAHAGHPLAGVAYLQLADRKFEDADYKAAGTFYSKAAASLKNEALLGRAKLGAAVSQLSGGDKAGGEAALKAVGSDQALPKAVRAEANYHLASLANEAGDQAEAGKYIEEVTKIDLGGPWAQRATMLLGTLQVAGKDAAPGVSFTPVIK